MIYCIWSHALISTTNWKAEHLIEIHWWHTLWHVWSAKLLSPLQFISVHVFTLSTLLPLTPSSKPCLVFSLCSISLDINFLISKLSALSCLWPHRAVSTRPSLKIKFESFILWQFDVIVGWGQSSTGPGKHPDTNPDILFSLWASSVNVSPVTEVQVYLFLLREVVTAPFLL